MESPPIWRPVPALAVALLGGLAMAGSAWLGPRGWTIWLVPFAITALAVRSTATPLAALWAALAIGGALPRMLQDPGKLSYALSAAEAIDVAAMVIGTRWLARRGNAVVLAVGVGCLRAAIELVWSATPLGDEFAWGLHALGCAPLAQSMTLLGVTGLSWLVAAVPASLAVFLCDLNRVGAARVMSLSFALLALCAGIGAGRLEQVPSESVKVAAVGPLPASEQELRGLTALAAAEQAEVVVWPENAITLPAVGGELVRARLETLAHNLNIWLVIGVVDEEAGVGQALLIPPRSVEAGLAMSAPLHTRPFEPTATAGAPPEAELARFGAISAMFGADAMFAAPARAAARSGATVLALPTLGRSPASPDEGLLARARAVENSLVVVRSCRGAPGTVIDPYGRQVAMSPAAANDLHFVVADAPLVRAGLALSHLRAAVPWAAVLLLLVLVRRPSLLRHAPLGERRRHDVAERAA